ncbi:PREDICTED: acid phosphatase 1-like isoform X1 [Camelina sativa]|uniref:Acid phosphatase 1-like isoform X1 n=2 Tax=Camelina sativa TaxID=90675 RepID=A0ABM0ULK0_CAMSA|nr:PREDICTED: acid phosphatase 1-like isoform X1 [Camelina sativa]
MKIYLILLLVVVSLFSSSAFSDDSILEYPSEIESMHKKAAEEDVDLHCTTWRFAAEMNNLAPWKSIPAECADYVKNYVMGKGYATDLERVSEEALIFANSVEFSGDGKDIWVFDIDETLLSNLPYYIDHGFGLELFDHSEFDKWVERGVAPAIAPSLKLYQRVVDLGYKVFLLTGRKESHRLVTVENLINAGFQNWDKLILRSPEEQHKMATLYKSEKRDEMVKEGYRIRGNSGDQWSDLLGTSMSQRSFKLANPMYYIP